MSPPSRSSSVNLSARHSVVHLSRHTLKQLKFVLPGGVATYLLGTVAKLGQLLENESRWARIYAKSSLFCGIITIGLFLYILLVPWLKGTRPNYSKWRQSGELSTVVPILTGLMALGWPLLSYTLSHWTDLGLIKGVIASSALYALAFGLLGLVPAPMVKRQ
ncbi:hypothetical protein PNOK_0765800 [Pyrrhoderma noxium]|uniref:Uncharacterized protein n=1 Tax=Pyrrhoderma noxium TaxID=2282107 RepID=A0A286U8X3_9AGAM|nr:hypothetical protein PNOK_0765800 [Pyrrhoderma noxium]